MFSLLCEFNHLIGTGAWYDSFTGAWERQQHPAWDDKLHQMVHTQRYLYGNKSKVGVGVHISSLEWNHNDYVELQRLAGHFALEALHSELHTCCRISWSSWLGRGRHRAKHFPNPALHLQQPTWRRKYNQLVLGKLVLCILDQCVDLAKFEYWCTTDHIR